MKNFIVKLLSCLIPSKKLRHRFRDKYLNKTNILEEIKILREDIIYETRSAIAVSALHSKVFPQFKNINRGKDVVIIGTGPTLKDFQPIKDAVYIGLNKAFCYDKVKFDYLFAIDYSGTKQYFDEFTKYNCVKFLGQVCNQRFNIYNPDKNYTCHIPESQVKDDKTFRYYSDAHRTKIHYNIESFPLADMGSVSFQALHFALYTYPRRIYLVGLDTSNAGYYDNIKSSNRLPVDFVKHGYRLFKTFIDVYYPDIEIISINPVGLKGIYNDKWQTAEDGIDE